MDDSIYLNRSIHHVVSTASGRQENMVKDKTTEGCACTQNLLDMLRAAQTAKKTSLTKITCSDCGKVFCSNADRKLCFDCEAKKR